MGFYYQKVPNGTLDLQPFRCSSDYKLQNDKIRNPAALFEENHTKKEKHTNRNSLDNYYFRNARGRPEEFYEEGLLVCRERRSSHRRHCVYYAIIIWLRNRLLFVTISYVGKAFLCFYILNIHLKEHRVAAEGPRQFSLTFPWPKMIFQVFSSRLIHNFQTNF